MADDATAGAKRYRRRQRATVRKGDPDALINYAPNGRVLAEHMLQSKYAQVLIGPLGSAKTTNNIVKMVREWSRAPIDPADGVRKSRWAAVRNTYADLVGTTIKDFMELVEPLEIGQLKASDMGRGGPVFRAEYVAGDGVRTQAELNFLAFDLPGDVKKARGLRLSGVWFNELKELAKANMDMVMSRLRRYRPDLYNAQPHCWYGMLGDSNAPDTDHWLYLLYAAWREGRMPNWWFGIQPGGVIHRGGQFTVNPDAENLAVVTPTYYEQQLEGKKESWIRQNLGNEFVFHADGRPIHPDFNERLHVAEVPLKPHPGIGLTLGFDFGRTPAMAVLQQQPDGRWFVLDEVCGMNTTARPFGRRCYRYLNQHYTGFSYDATADPAGDTPGEQLDDTLIQLLEGTYNKPGIIAAPAFTNNFSERIEALDGLLRENIGGQPAIVFSPNCKVMIGGLAGKYRLKRVQVAGDERFHDKPDKNINSHICEALHYALMGAGEGTSTISNDSSEEYREVEQEYGGWHPPQHYFE